MSFVFFKQKTAYEMRISDWSSDVCSSDLDAGRGRPGNTVLVKAAGRQATARVTFVSPALDPQTRLVPALATLDNRGGEWRVGEPVTAAVQLTGSGGGGAIRVPTTAVQSFEGKSVVFVRTRTGFKATPDQLGDASGDT